MQHCAAWTSCGRCIVPHRAQPARSGNVPTRRCCTRQWVRVAAKLQQGGGGSGPSVSASSGTQLLLLACTGALAAVLCGAVGGAAGFMYSTTTVRFDLLTSEVRELRREVQHLDATVQKLIAEEGEAFKKVSKTLEPLEVVKDPVETVQSIAEATT